MKLKTIDIVALLAVALLAVFPLVISDEYYLHLAILFLMWVVIGSAWNLFAGYTGQVSFGHAAFFGAGAYAAGLLNFHFGISAWWGMAIGGFVAVLVGLPFGLICFPLRGAYFALASLALGEMLMHAAKIAERFTGGMSGVMIMPSFVSKVPYFYIALALAVATILALHYVINSKLGYYFVSIREDQEAAESLGVNATKYKTISLGISAFWTGMAGALYMNYMGFIDPEVVFSLTDYSIMAILVAIVGGAGTVYGPAVGAIIMVAVKEFVRSGFFGFFKYLSEYTGSSAWGAVGDFVSKAHVLSFGLIVVLGILLLPNGIVGDWEKIRRSVFRRKSNA